MEKYIFEVTITLLLRPYNIVILFSRPIEICNNYYFFAIYNYNSQVNKIGNRIGMKNMFPNTFNTSLNVYSSKNM